MASEACSARYPFKTTRGKDDFFSCERDEGHVGAHIACQETRSEVAWGEIPDAHDEAIRAEERERCAKVCRALAERYGSDLCSGGDIDREHLGDRSLGALDADAAIRSLGPTPTWRADEREREDFNEGVRESLAECNAHAAWLEKDANNGGDGKYLREQADRARHLATLIRRRLRACPSCGLVDHADACERGAQ